MPRCGSASSRATYSRDLLGDQQVIVAEEHGITPGRPPHREGVVAEEPRVRCAPEGLHFGLVGEACEIGAGAVGRAIVDHHDFERRPSARNCSQVERQIAPEHAFAVEGRNADGESWLHRVSAGGRSGGRLDREGLRRAGLMHGSRPCGSARFRNPGVVRPISNSGEVSRLAGAAPGGWPVAPGRAPRSSARAS